MEFVSQALPTLEHKEFHFRVVGSESDKRISVVTESLMVLFRIATFSVRWTESYVMLAISNPHVRVKHCAYGHSVATLLNPLGGTTVSHEYSLTVARYAIVVVAVPSTLRCPANYRIKPYYFRWNLNM
jgi:hypothetical protein